MYLNHHIDSETKTPVLTDDLIDFHFTATLWKVFINQDIFFTQRNI